MWILTWKINSSIYKKTNPQCFDQNLVTRSFIQTLNFKDPNFLNMSDKLCLQWNDFQENIKSAFGKLREESDFKDVTLICEDGQQVEAHKVILTASSPLFQKLLCVKSHPHPLIYRRHEL